MTTEAEYRLPRTAIPTHYELTLEPDLAAAAFSGTVAITLDLVDRTTDLVLNAAELEIAEAELVASDGTTWSPQPTLDEAAERLTLAVDDALAPGTYTLRVDFAGTLNDQLRGFYRSTYKDDDGREHVLATTQFEATEARRAFPCWDEPDAKATFDVTLVIAPGLQAVSNSPIVDDDITEDGRRRLRFATTMKMSTYLVAFVIGELEATDPVDVDGVPLRIVHVAGKGHLTDFALDAGAFALRYFTEYYGIPYPGAKVDMIGIPDFAFGAMENLGAITYRESVLLVDPQKATQAELQRVADVIAHELAHMWFGDLVTMKWWNGIWLNEAFATFMELKCIDAYRPDWKHWLGFCADRNASMDIDGLATTRPIEFPVASPEEANEMFDVLTYEKGASVLRMLEQYLGEDTFRLGISRYLKTHAYANTETADLWAALEQESGEPVGDIMDSWILQGGHPRLDVEPVDGGHRLRQEPFRFLKKRASPGAVPGVSPQPDEVPPPVPSPPETSRRWQVPVLYRSDTGEGRILLGDDVVVETGPGLLVNAGGHGYYRVRYAPDLLADVTRRVPELDAHERYVVVADTWADVLAGDAPAMQFLDVVSRLSGETEPHVWDLMIAGLGELDRVVSSDARPDLQRFVRTLIGPAVGRVGWEPRVGESDLDRRFRGSLLRALGALGEDRETITEARRLFEGVLDGSGGLDGEVATAVLATVAAEGDRSVHARLVAAYEAAPTPQEEDRLLAALAAVPDPEAGADTIAMILDGRIRSHSAGQTVARLVAVRESGPRNWQGVKEHWDDLIARMPQLTARNMLSLLHYRSEPDVARDIREWLAGHEVPGAQKYAPQQLERLAVRVGLRQRESGLKPPAG